MTLHEFINQHVHMPKTEISSQGVDPDKNYQDTTLGELEKIAVSVGLEWDDLVTE